MKRLAPFIVVGLVLVGLLVAPLALFRPDRYRQTLINQLSKTLGHPVLVSKVEGGYFPPSLKIIDFSVLKGAETRYLHVDRAEAKLGWSALFGGAIKPAQLSVQGFQITMTRRADGSWDASEWLPSLSGVSAGSAGVSSAVALKGGEIRWVDDFAPVRTELKATSVEGRVDASTLKLAGTLGGVALPTSFTLDATGLWGGREGTGEVRLTDGGRTSTVRVERKAGTTQWISESPEWRLDNAWAIAQFALRLRQAGAPQAGSSFLRNWKAQYTVSTGTKTYTANATLDGGVLEAKGTLQSTNGKPSTQLMMALQNVPLPSLAPVLGSWLSGMEGKVTGLLSDFSMELSSRSWETARGNLTFEASDGFYRFPPPSLQYVQKARTAQYLRKKFPDLSEKGLPVLKARLVGRFENGGLTVQSAGVVAGSVRVGVVGRLETVQRSVEGYAMLQIRETSASLIKLLPERYVYGDPGEEKVQPIFGRLQGNWSEWKVRSLPKSKVPGTAQRGLRSGASSVTSK